MMAHKIGSALLGLGMLATASSADENATYKPLDFGGFSEFGQIQNGQFGNNAAFKDEWVDHFGAYIAQTVGIGDELAFDVGLGGVFEFQKKEVVSAQWGGSQYKGFFVGPSVADLRWKAAAGDGQGFGLQFGMFGYKYNPDASNLGEYLFRTGAYPSYITSGGFWFLNNASVQLQSLRLSYNRGALTTDLFLVTETSMPALYDISAAALVGYKFADGLLDIGAGVNFKHMIPMKPSRTSPKRASNSYFTKNDTLYTGFDAYYFSRRDFGIRKQKEYQAESDALTAKGDPASLAAATAAKAKADAYGAQAIVDDTTGNRVRNWLENPDSNGIKQEYYTQQGIILMARAALDFKKLIGSEAFGPNDLRLYAEAAILGVQNYPFYYEKMTERMPIMFGFNLPGMKVIDLISIQAEYFNSPWINSYWEQVRSNSAIPTTPDGADKTRNTDVYGGITKDDNLSWSVLVKKNIGKGAYVSGQVARDHLRTVSIDTWTALEPDEVLGHSKDWYWMLQFGFGI